MSGAVGRIRTTAGGPYLKVIQRDGAPYLPVFGRCGSCTRDDTLLNMPYGLKRYQESRQTHFVTFSCYQRLPFLQGEAVRDLFLERLECVRRTYRFRVYGYVVMPEHVHLLVSEPKVALLGTALQALKISVSRRVKDPHLLTAADVGHRRDSGSEISASQSLKDPHLLTAADVGHRRVASSLWQRRYYDHNVRTYESFVQKLRYLHRNPVKRGLVEKPEDWKWSSFRHYLTADISPVEVESQWTADRRSGREPDPLRIRGE